MVHLGLGPIFSDEAKIVGTQGYFKSNPKYHPAVCNSMLWKCVEYKSKLICHHLWIRQSSFYIFLVVLKVLNLLLYHEKSLKDALIFSVARTH